MADGQYHVRNGFAVKRPERDLEQAVVLCAIKQANDQSGLAGSIRDEQLPTEAKRFGRLAKCPPQLAWSCARVLHLEGGLARLAYEEDLDLAPRPRLLPQEPRRDDACIIHDDHGPWFE